MFRNMAEGIQEQLRNMGFFMTLTCVFLGLQGVFTVILPMGTPYMLSLGISKSVMALLWLAGPVIGAVASPYFGFVSDRNRSSMGKRRPYIIAGTVGAITNLLCLAWVRDIATVVGHRFLGVSEQTLQPFVLCAAVLLLWGAILCVQPITVALRALIVDLCTSEQQGEANAWVGRAIGLGSIFGYALASVDMSGWFAGQTNSQYKAVSVFMSAILGVTVAFCCLLTREKDPSLLPKEEDKSFYRQIAEIFKSASRLSPQVWGIFRVQFCAWFGWYCFLFYTTTWIAELYVDQNSMTHQTGTAHRRSEDFPEAAVRQGSFALLLTSIVNFATTLFAPALIEFGGRKLSTQEGSAVMNFFKRYIRTPSARFRAGWVFSQFLFGLCMMSTFFITSTRGATVMVAVLGICFALSLQVVPFTLISSLLAKHQRPEDASDDVPETKTQYEYRPGTVLGLHNVAICAPQLIASFCSSLIFALGGRLANSAGENTVDPESTAWVLRSGGIAAFLAAYMACRIKDIDDDADLILGEYEEIGTDRAIAEQDIE